MKIFTSYFAQVKKIPTNIIPVSICGKAPTWYDGLQYKALAPKYDFFLQYKNDHDVEAYTVSYTSRILDTLKVSEVMVDLAKLSHNNDVVLLCYEKPCDFCHRQLVAEWLSKHTGCQVNEI